MHDWWLALCAAATGRLRCAPGTTVRYRQHAHNRIGAVSLSASLELVSRYCELFERPRGRLARVTGVLRLGVRRQDPLRQLLLLLKLLATPPALLAE